MANKDSTLTQDYVKSLFDYKDGNLYWKTKTTKFSPISAGKIAGALSSNGYINIGINNKLYLNHRIIFLYHHGYMPKLIDHIDRNKQNNNIENLREVTRAENRVNAKLQKNNISGCRNVNWSKKERKWVVQMAVNKKKLRFGTYYDLEVAKFIAETMQYKYYGLIATKR